MQKKTHFGTNFEWEQKKPKKELPKGNDIDFGQEEIHEQTECTGRKTTASTRSETRLEDKQETEQRI